MKLWIGGGTGEHGRNCFYVEGESSCFLVDCGRMADCPEDPYPRLSRAQIQRLEAVFLTHSHADHAGALPWLYANGFRGTLLAAEETLRQLPAAFVKHRALRALGPGGAGQFQTLALRWGRSGHCAGSVWYKFSEKEKSIFFSGDYTENTLVYACDPIRRQSADLAVLDCAYGSDETSYAAACARLLRETERLWAAHQLLLFPVPKYGRGLEILSLLAGRLKGLSFYGDKLFLQNLAARQAGGYWYLPEKTKLSVRLYGGQPRGIVFVSDPQLKSESAQQTAKQVLALGGAAIMSGTLEKGSYSEVLCQQGQMERLLYPVHLNDAQFSLLQESNCFKRCIPFHSPEFSGPREILF